MIDYIAQYAGGELHTSEESIEVGWFTPEEAQKMITHSTYQYRLEKILTLK
jgi:8-oxo-dGTP diphosphatase